MLELLKLSGMVFICTLIGLVSILLSLNVIMNYISYIEHKFTDKVATIILALSFSLLGTIIFVPIILLGV